MVKGLALGRLGRSAIGLVLFASVAGAAPVVRAACYNADDMVAKVAESGLPWERRTENVWRVDLQSRTRGEINVIAVCSDENVVVFSVLAYAKELQPSRELLTLLLRAAAHFDRVKLTIDEDGDYAVRIDVWAQYYNGAVLASAANQVRAVIDEMTDALRKFHASKQ
jgi:hypothetical protein